MKYKLPLGAIFVMLALVVGLVTGATVSATSKFLVSDSENFSINENDTVDGSVYLVGPTIQIDGTVNGDVYCAGENITVNGTINGDVICAGQTVNLDGTINGNIRIIASDILLTGTVSGSASVLASTVQADENFSLGKDMSGAAENMNLDGSFGRDIAVAATDLRLGADVTRNVSVYTRDISLDNQGSIGGDLWYKSDESANIESGVVSGDTTHVPQEKNDQTGSYVWTVVFGILTIVVLATSAVLVAPRYVHTAASQPLRNVLLAFLIGITTTLLLPVIAVLLMVSSVGLLFGIALFIAWLLLLVMSFAFASYYVGGLVLQKRATNALIVAAVGGLVIGFLIFIPVINSFVSLASVAVGVGMQVMHVKYQFSKNPYTIAP